MTELNFQKEKVEQVVQDFKKLTLSTHQKESVNKISMLMKQFLPLKMNAIKGSMWLTIKKWQSIHGKPLADLSKMTNEKRIEAVKELISMGREQTMKMLIDPDGQKELLDDAFEKATKMALDVMEKQ